MPLGVARVHTHDLGGKQGRFVAARAGANFDDDVFLVIRIFRQQPHFQLGFNLFAPLFQLDKLRAGKLEHLGVVFQIKHLARIAQTLIERLELAVLGDDFFKVAVLLGYARILRLIGERLRVAELLRQLFVLLFDGIELVEHNSSVMRDA